MIKFLRNLNFGYFLLLAGPIVCLVAYQKLKVLMDGATDATQQDWLQAICIAIAGVYLIVAGILKIYKAKPKKSKRV